MKERPILFWGAMVRALLDGSKTQTRRVVKWRDLQAGLNLSFSGLEVYSYVPGLFTLEGRSRNSAESRSSPTRCPYGVPGERLWVREAWRAPSCVDDLTPSELPAGYSISFAADGGEQFNGRARPGMLMPRWASRITLEVTGVRVERLQAISRGDAMNEGCPFPNMAKGDDPRQWYRDLWESINGAGSWAANPFVWCVSFRRL